MLRLISERRTSFLDLIIKDEEQELLPKIKRPGWHDDWRNAVAELGLLQPTFQHQVDGVYLAFRQWQKEIGATYRINALEHSEKLVQTIDALRTKMRASLGVDDPLADPKPSK